MNLLLILVIIAWLIGACLRVYRQARFYQIEEYMSARYLRWLFGERQRWLPNRPLAAWFVGVAIGVLSEAPNSPLPYVIGIIAAAAAGAPPREKEVKKPFKRTARATRLLAAAFSGAAAFAGAGVVVIGVLPEIEEVRFVAAMVWGLLVFLLAPLWLVLGNVLMTPVEAASRARFISKAERVLEEANLTVIGITGSYGKTSTKTYLAHILNSRYKAYPTPKSYNTLMGLCLAINNDIANDHSLDYFIAEMGAYIPGEIERICELTHPSVGVVIEVGPQHLERFGSLENVALAKYEIIKGLPPDGVGVFNWDNPYVREMFERGYPQTRIAVSRSENPPNEVRFVASNVVEALSGLTFTVTDRQTGQAEEFKTALLGLHSVTNLLLATAVAVQEKVPLKEVARAVRTLQPAESRLVRRVTPEGITIINDAYSANPVGAVESLKVLGMHTTGRRLLITPGMVELGTLMDSENHKLGETAAKHATDVILVGAKQTEAVKAGLLAAGFEGEKLQVVDTLATAMAWYQTNLKAGDTVLFLNDLPDVYSS